MLFAKRFSLSWGSIDDVVRRDDGTVIEDDTFSRLLRCILLPAGGGDEAGLFDTP